MVVSEKSVGLFETITCKNPSKSRDVTVTMVLPIYYQNYRQLSSGQFPKAETVALAGLARQHLGKTSFSLPPGSWLFETFFCVLRYLDPLFLSFWVSPCLPPHCFLGAGGAGGAGARGEWTTAYHS